MRRESPVVRRCLNPDWAKRFRARVSRGIEKRERRRLGLLVRSFKVRRKSEKLFLWDMGVTLRR